jgi:hypothetical protein
MDGLLGVAGMIIDSKPVDHSRKFPAFSTSKIKCTLLGQSFRRPRRKDDDQGGGEPGEQRAS